MKEKMKFIALTLVLIISSVAILTGCMYALAEAPAEESEYDRSDFVDDSLLASAEEPAAESADAVEEEEPVADNTDDGLTEAPEAPAEPVAAENFAAQVSLHSYKTSKIALVKVKNLGEVNSKVTVTGSYLDENGDVIGTESKSFDGFDPGLENNFIFNPGYAFADFTYTIAAETTEKTPYASQIEVYGRNKGGWLKDTQGNMFYRAAPLNAYDYQWDPVTWEPIEGTETVDVCIDIVHVNHAKDDVYVTYDWMVLDANGDVFHVGDFGSDMDAETPVGMEGYSSRPIYSVRTDSEEFKANLDEYGDFCPEALKDGFTVVIALTDVSHYEQVQTVWYLSELLDFFVGELGYDYDYIVNWAFEEAEWRGIELIVDVDL